MVFELRTVCDHFLLALFKSEMNTDNNVSNLLHDSVIASGKSNSDSSLTSLPKSSIQQENGSYLQGNAVVNEFNQGQDYGMPGLQFVYGVDVTVVYVLLL